jgi:hypothetical protein
MTCFEFALAPWDLNHQNPDPSKAPDVLNNSWGYFGGGNNLFHTVVQNLRNAGVLTEVSSGNEGPSCSSLRSPADYDNVFSTGATANRSETLVSFSSRGPSLLYPNIKPDIVAPGENINSSLPGGGYSGETWSGTSMAGPHTVGAVALIVSANPGMKGQVEAIEDLIRDTAYTGMPTPPAPTTCGGIPYNVVPNHIYGWGRLDALAAVALVASSGHFQGFVRDQGTNNPIEGATVDTGTGISTSTDATGYYTMTVPAGTYTMTASAYGWLPKSVPNVVIVEDQTTNRTFRLDRAPRYRLSGRTFDQASGQPIQAHIELLLNGVPVAQTNSDPVTGQYQMRPFAGVYDLIATAPGYSPVEMTVNMNRDRRINLFFQASWLVDGDTAFQYWRFDGEYFDSGAAQPYDQKVYFLGGRLADGTTNGTVWSYDPLTGAYAMTGATMPVPISNYTVNLLQDANGLGLYIFGGRDNAGVMRSEVQVYYPATNTTAVVATDPLPGAARIVGASAVVNNRAYVFGGFDSLSVYAQTYRYNPAAAAGSRWTPLGNLNLARAYLMTAVVDGKIYAIGGDTWDGVNLLPQTMAEVFDTANPVAGWNDAAAADLPMACDEAQAWGFDTAGGGGYAGQVLTAGCGQWPAEFPDSFAYDVAANTWDAGFSDLNQARRNHAGAYIPVGSLPGLWVFGGRQGADTTILTSTEYFLIP